MIIELSLSHSRSPYQRNKRKYTKSIFGISLAKRIENDASLDGSIFLMPRKLAWVSHGFWPFFWCPQKMKEHVA